MKYFADYSSSRDNNLSLLRFVAATAVLVSHAWPITLGTGTPEPSFMGASLGTLAVYFFFFISGLLVTGSWERKPDAANFLAARFLRLMPGLWISIAIVTLVLGPLVTSMPIRDYLLHKETWTFVFRNFTLFQPQYTLPGVFTDSPYPTIEGSIWTLFYEATAYIGILILGVVGVLSRQTLATAVFLSIILLWPILDLLGVEVFYKFDQAIRLATPFSLGALTWIWRAWVPLYFPITIMFFILAWSASATDFALVTLCIFLGSFVLWISYVPSGVIRLWNGFGDYSYGIYVYAFPIQGVVVWLYGSMSPWLNILFAFPLTLFFALVSWHWIEEPSLARRISLTRYLSDRAGVIYSVKQRYLTRGGRRRFNNGK